MKGSDRCYAENTYCSVSGQKLRVSNVGPGGLYAVCHQPPAPGESVSVELALPTRTLKVDATVSWVNPPEEPVTHAVPPGFGVHFGELSATDRLVLAEYIRRSDTLLRDGRGVPARGDRHTV
jgi:hypothetical protein